MSSRKDLPPPRTDDVLTRRFSLTIPEGSPPPTHTPHTSRIPHTSHTPIVSPAETPSTPERTRSAEPDGMTRRTYYYDRKTADTLATAVNTIHHRSNGLVAKHRILEAIIQSGLTQLDHIETQLRGGTKDI